MAGKIFVNYRRGDDPGFAQALFAHLAQAFPPEQLFMDVDSIEPGLDFVRVLNDQVAQCDVLISIIGKNWLDARDANGARRLDSPEDFVRIEIESALQQDKRVIPVLVGQAQMPSGIQLPATMKPFARRNAVRLTHERFRADTQGLIAALQRALKSADDARAAQAREEERKRQEAAAVRQQTEAQLQRRETEKRRAEEEEREREAEEDRRKREADPEQRRIAELEAKRRADAEQRQREAEAQQQKAEAGRQKAEQQRLREEAEAQRRAEEDQRRAQEQQRLREEAEAQRRAEEDQRRAQAEEQHRLRRAQARPLWPRSRALLVATSLLAAAVVGLGLWLFAMPGDVSALSLDQERALRPKDTFKECTSCPQMIAVPAGSFTMGSSASEQSRFSIVNEGPQHVITISGQFAVGQYELTFEGWDACVAGGGCNAYRPSDQDWGRGRRPVINVSWDDAKAYVAWLAKKTGKPYRLLTEAEYEYAARAGTTTAYPWGNDIKLNGQVMANCYGCGSQWDKQTAPVGSFAANGFGLNDMVGNVWEWTEDCYNRSYNGAPSDGSAWISGDCNRRILRGGSWDSNPVNVRSAWRFGFNRDNRGSDIGFRVGRTLLAP